MMRRIPNIDMSRRRHFKCSHINKVSNSAKTKRHYNERDLNLCTPFNKTANVCHERMDDNFYEYDINATIFRLLKNIHKLQQEYNENIDNQRSRGTNWIDYQMEKIFMCYTSIYKNIERNLFLKLTLELLKCPVLYKKITYHYEFYEQILFEINRCSHDKEVMNKTFFYEHVIKIISTLLKNSKAFNESCERTFFLDTIKMMHTEENINYFIKHFTFLLSCISLYKRELKKEIYFNTINEVITEEHTSLGKKIFLVQKKKQIIQNCMPIILQIFNKIEHYNYLNQMDICNIMDFLNEFKQYHKIKSTICKDIHKYFTTSSDMKNLCLILYLLACSKNDQNEFTGNAYSYIYNIICLRPNELFQPKNMNLFLISIIRWKSHKQGKVYRCYNSYGNKNQSNRYAKIDTKKTLGRRRTPLSVECRDMRTNAMKKEKSKNKKFQLCLDLRNKFIKKQKMKNDKKMYFWIKQYFLQFIKREQKSNKHIKTFYQYFLSYHINKNFTRKKNYISPITIIKKIGKI
ncbi:hypothetical protein, conserved [Plasmodium gonderi]|uniref:Uncharacterized protein n=1 Tax=Plasmodium gonderi TaxID=77519 RepID=A0A1Y1JML2_PLAGO|nr:hypothetical protein, conserved [Plasmodium gonderi]GAW83480.1 hypothetical protein, conserved [Plasmodium gonderi]